MIYLGLDPGTSGNMALAALFPETEGVTALHPIRVALIEGAAGDNARDRAWGVAASTKKAIAELTSIHGDFALAVVWQQPRENDRRPQNILDLQGFMGLAMGAIQASLPLREVLVPLPSEWKGQTPKHVKQNRIVAVAGLRHVQMALKQAGLRVPPNLGAFEQEFSGMASDVIDAIGLAFWLREKLRMKALIRSRMPTSRG